MVPGSLRKVIGGVRLWWLRTELGFSFSQAENENYASKADFPQIIAHIKVVYCPS